MSKTICSREDKAPDSLSSKMATVNDKMALSAYISIKYVTSSVSVWLSQTNDDL